MNSTKRMDYHKTFSQPQKQTSSNCSSPPLLSPLSLCSQITMHSTTLPKHQAILTSMEPGWRLTPRLMYHHLALLLSMGLCKFPSERDLLANIAISWRLGSKDDHELRKVQGPRYILADHLILLLKWKETDQRFVISTKMEEYVQASPGSVSR